MDFVRSSNAHAHVHVNLTNLACFSQPTNEIAAFNFTSTIRGKTAVQFVYIRYCEVLIGNSLYLWETL